MKLKSFLERIGAEINNNKHIKKKIFNIVFGTDTFAGKFFDIILIVFIIANTLLVILESVENIRQLYANWFSIFGWIFLGVFAAEYLIRLWVVKKKRTYVLSFFGIIDFLSITPIFLALLFPNIGFIVIVRIFRLIRLFSILKMARFIEESFYLIRALKASRPKITIFLFSIIFLVIIVGALMYIIEGPENGFNSIPESMYWGIVTVSTVGYGDISPQTVLGKFLASLLMLITYGIIAVPTGIISHELAKVGNSKKIIKKCEKCYAEYYRNDDRFCSKCSNELSDFLCKN